MHLVFGLIDPHTKRVFHVGCTRDIEVTSLPTPAVKKVTEIEPDVPQIVVLQEVESRPLAAWVKWCKRFRRDLVTNDWQLHTNIADAFTNSNRVKRALGEEVPSDAAYQQKFHDFDRQNPEVFGEMLRKARELKAQGRKLPGMDEITNDIQWEGRDTNHTDGFKINDSHRAFYARKLQMVDPSLCGLFAMRESVADDLVLEDGRSWLEFAKEHSESLRYAAPEDTDEGDTEWTY